MSEDRAQMAMRRFVRPDGNLLAEIVESVQMPAMDWYKILPSGLLYIGGNPDVWIGPWRLEGRLLPDGEWIVLGSSENPNEVVPFGHIHG